MRRPEGTASGSVTRIVRRSRAGGAGASFGWILTDAAERRALKMCRDDAAVACVAWWLNELVGILLVRHSDGALTFVVVQEEARRDLRMFDRNAVIRPDAAAGGAMGAARR